MEISKRFLIPISQQREGDTHMRVEPIMVMVTSAQKRFLTSLCVNGELMTESSGVFGLLHFATNGFTTVPDLSYIPNLRRARTRTLPEQKEQNQ